MNEVELVKLKQKIEEAKSKVSELKGHKNALMKQLKDNWNCDTLQEANDLINKMEKEVGDIEEEIKKGLEELEVKYSKYKQNFL